MPVVVTVHDLAVFRHPETFPPWTREYSRRRRPARASRNARIVAVSEFTASELETLLGVPRERIRVVPNGVEDVFTPDGPREDGDYVLAVGTLEPRKNLARIDRGHAAARRRAARRGRARAGGASRRAAPASPGSASRPDDELARLYRGARCLAYPSLYEGFGIPVLEAMACGTPVVTSRGGATEEVAGGAAVLVDPLDVASIAAGIEEATARRDELRAARACERARAFSWDESARRTVDVVPRGGGVSVRSSSSTPTCSAGSAPATRRTSRTCSRAPAAATLRFAALTRRPDLVPAGIEPIELPLAHAGARACSGACRGSCAGCGPALAHFQHALPLGLPCPAVLTVHDLSFERDRSLMGARDRAIFRLVVPRAVAPRARTCSPSPSGRRTTSSSCTASPPEKITVTPLGLDPAFRPGGTRGDVPAVRRRGRAAQEPAARRRRRAGVGMPLVVVGPERDAALAARAARGAAPTCAATCRRTSSSASTGGARCLVSRRGTRASGSRRRGDGVRDAGRRAPDAAVREIAGDAAAFADRRPRRRRPRGARRPRAVLARPASRARACSPGSETARRTLAVYREALA